MIADAALQPVVIAVAPGAVPTGPVAGQCWVVGPAAPGAWAGHDGEIALWTSGGWRFLASFDGMTAWSLADSQPIRRSAGQWSVGALRGSSLTLGGVQVVGRQGSAIAAPTAGITVDAEARTTISVILSTLRTHGLIAT